MVNMVSIMLGSSVCWVILMCEVSLRKSQRHMPCEAGLHHLNAKSLLAPYCMPYKSSMTANQSRYLKSA